MQQEERKKEEILSWNQYFMELARLASRRSKDPKTKVGCVLIDERTKHILSIGYNGLPVGFNDAVFDWEEKDGFDKNPYVVHAEVNALLNSTASIEGATAYITMFPCVECSKLLAQARIAKIVYDDDKFRNKESGKIAEEILHQTGVMVEKYDPNK